MNTIKTQLTFFTKYFSVQRKKKRNRKRETQKATETERDRETYS